MYAKYIIFAFLAFFAVQGVVQAKTISHPIQRNVIDDLRKLIQNLKEYIENAIAAAIEKVKELIANLKNFVANLIVNAKAKLDELFLNITATIEKLQEEASKVGIDVTECIQGHQKEIEALKDKVMVEIMDCASKQIEQAQAIVNIITSEINNVMSFVTSIQNKAKECGVNVVCYASLIKEAYNLFAELPTDIAKLLAKATSIISTINSEIPACINSKILKFVTAAGSVMVVIGKCVAEKTSQLYY